MIKRATLWAMINTMVEWTRGAMVNIAAACQIVAAK